MYALDTTETTIPTLNGFISKTAVSGHESNTLDTTHLEVLRRHHAELVRMIGSLAEFNTLLVEAFAKEIIDPTTYEKFLMKQESNPHCSSTVLSGLLLLDIAKHLQEKPHLFLSFCKCIEKVNADCAKELKGIIIDHVTDKYCTPKLFYSLSQMIMRNTNRSYHQKKHSLRYLTMAMLMHMEKIH